MKKYLLIPLLLFIFGKSFAQCDVVVGLPDTVSMCAYTPYTFNIDTVGPYHVLNIAWSPSPGFNDTTLLNPTLTTPGVSTTYYVTVNALLDSNYVSNPHFSLGNVGFTSGWTFVTDGAFALATPGYFTITPNPLIGDASVSVNLPDHTDDAARLMYAVNGLGNTPTIVWQQTVAVTPGTNYGFSAWFANWAYHDTLSAGAPLLELQINGTNLTPEIFFNDSPGIWHKEFGIWNSGISTTAILTIMDNNIAGIGNAFALDDISLQQICTYVDSVYFNISRPDTTIVSHDTSVCSNIPSILLTVQDGYTFYLWNSGLGKDSQSVTSTGNYILYSFKSCAARIDTFNATFIPLPSTTFSLLDTFCQYDSIIVRPLEPTGTTFTWSDGTTGDTDIIRTNGTYWVNMNNQGCITIDTIQATMHFTPLVKLGNDTASCLGVPIVLQSSVTYPSGVTYLWTTGWTAYDTTITSTGTYWLQVTDSGCVGSDTIYVQISYDTLHFNTPDTVNICKGNSYQTLVAGDPTITYLWIPTTGIADPNIPNPIITTDTSAEYVLTASIANCPTIYDSFFLSVQPTPNVYVKGYYNLCQFDTIHINASVTPPYPNYTYSWAPSVSLDNDTSSTVVFTSNFGVTDTTTLYLYVSTSAGCIGIDSSYIYSHPGKFLYVNPNIYLCPGDSVHLLDSGALYYHWTPGLYLSDSASDTPWIKPITTQNYTLTATSPYGCLDTQTFNATVYPSAVIKIPDTLTIYPGETYQFQPYTNCVNFQWFPPDGLSSDIISNPSITPSQDITYLVVGSTNNNCVVSDTVHVIMDLTTIINVPNAFTPGQSSNNVLYIQKAGLATLNYFRIFDRWGNKVFETNNIDDGWDGTFHGAAQPFGVYVYEIQAITNLGKLYTRQGNITLIR